MGNILPNKEGCSAYPGEYVPMPETEELLKCQKECVVHPLTNLDEFNDFFRVEVSLPGIQRQDIIIHIENDILSIIVMHKDQGDLANRSRIHEFDMNNFEKQISLPENADAELATAEYRDGILYLYIPKVTEHSKLQPGCIVVY